MSAKNLLEEIGYMKEEIREFYIEKQKKSGTYLFDNLPEEWTEFMEDVRLGRKKFEQ